MKNILFFGGASMLAHMWANNWKDKYNIFLGINKRSSENTGVKIIQLSNHIDELESLIKELKIDVIINCSGLTGVEECENNPKKAEELNGLLPGQLSKLCFNTGAKLVHISTDHLFNGLNKNMNELSEVIPLNTYAKSKYLGECNVIENNENALIIRTNFYGIGPSYRPSFSDRIISSLKLNREIHLFDNVYYTPIHIDELINIVELLLKKNKKGIFNVSSNERITKFNFGILLAEKLKLNKRLIIPIKIEKKKDLVTRPKDMSLSNNKLFKEINYKVKTIQDQLSTLIQNY